MSVEDHAVSLSTEERQEVARCLTTRRDDLDKERKRMEDRGLRTDPVDEVLDIHRGDGATNGLVAKFAPRDNRDIFDDPEPVGDITVLGGKSGKRVISEGGDMVQLTVDVFAGRLKPDLIAGARAIDSEGTVFQLGVLCAVEPNHLGKLCQKDGCDRVVEDGESKPCQDADCPQNPPEPEPKLEKEKGKAKDAPAPTEEAVDAKKLENRKALAIEAVNGATEMPVPDRRRVIQFILESASLTYMSEVTSWKAGEKFPMPPKGWKPAGKDEGAQEDYTGLKFSPAAGIFAKELGIPRSYLDGMGTGKGGSFTLGDVEDANNRRITAEA